MLINILCTVTTIYTCLGLNKFNAAISFHPVKTTNVLRTIDWTGGSKSSQWLSMSIKYYRPTCKNVLLYSIKNNLMWNLFYFQKIKPLAMPLDLTVSSALVKQLPILIDDNNITSRPHTLWLYM